MSLKAKQLIIAVLAAAFLVSLIFVQWKEIVRKEEELGLRPPNIIVPASSRACVDCHREQNATAGRHAPLDCVTCHH